MTTPDFTAILERFTGFGAHYNAVRPSPPATLSELLGLMAGYGAGERPGLVVDLGCGTGLSTRYWASRATQVIGIEPTASMLEEAIASPLPNVAYRSGYSHATDLPAGSADIVTCAQSLHWMDPALTFAESHRILRPGGIFAAYDYDWPPATSSWEVDRAYAECVSRSRHLEREHEIAGDLYQWQKSQHLARMEASGCYRYVVERVLHHRDEGTADRIVGLLLSQGQVQSLLKRGVSPEELGIDRLRDIAQQALGHTGSVWFWSARVRIGVR